MNKVSAKMLSKLAMIQGNEKKYSIVIDEDILKQWIGFGWIELREATTEDLKKYPIVIRGKNGE